MAEKKKKIFVDMLMAAGYWGGVENVVNRLGLYLKKQGFRVRITQLICEGDIWSDPELEFVYVFDSRLNMDLEKMYQGYKKMLESSDRKPDVILATNWPYMCYLGKRATEELGFNAPVIGYPHTNPWRFDEVGYGSIEMLDNADVCFAISNTIKDDMLKANPNAVVYRVNNPLPEGIKHANLDDRDPLSICYVGRLNVEKRPDLLIEAMGKCKTPYHLYLAGSGPMKTSLIKRAKELGINDRVHFLGWLTNPWEAVEKSSICVMASAFEGFSLTATEAMARGMALISTPVSGSIELIKPGETGYLFPHDDYEALADILDKIAEGILPSIDPYKCIEISVPFKSDIALFDTALKLFATANYKFLPYFDAIVHKVSVIVPIEDEWEFMEGALESIVSQSIGLDMIEIIIVIKKGIEKTVKIVMDYENRFPDCVMVINVDTDEDLEEVGLFYATGTYNITLGKNHIMEERELSFLLMDAITYRKSNKLGLV